MTLPHKRHIVKTTYFFVRGYLILLGGYLTIAHIQPPSENSNFSATELPVQVILGNPVGMKRAGAVRRPVNV